MKFNRQLVHYTFLRRVEPNNKLHKIWFSINNRPARFGPKEFALIMGLNYGRYQRDSKYVKAMEKGETFFRKIAKKRSVNAKRLLKLIRRDLSKIVDIDTIKMVDNLRFFERYPWGKESFALTLDYLKKQIDSSRQKKTFETKGVLSYALYEFSWAFMIWIYEAFFALSRGNGKSTEDPLHIPQLLRWHTSKGDKLIEGGPYFNGWSTKRVHLYLILTVSKMKQHYMKKFKAFTDKLKDAFIDNLKAHLEGVTAITLSEDGKDGYNDRDLGGNIISRHVTQGAGTSKPIASENTSMIVKSGRARVWAGGVDQGHR
ncbi:hypothetical protein FXO37_31109 [Capsicum annuum]|nr:hypothetical protein FXO37_31109 [Capsicum annuum]